MSDNLLRNASFVVVDVETTGLSAVTHRITEIAMLRVQQGKITQTFETLIDPQQYITPFIAQYTGITNTMVFGKPQFPEVAPKIAEFIQSTGGPLIVGHNVNFDHGFIAGSYSRAQLPLPYADHPSGLTPLLCTCKLARMLLPKLKKRSLKHVADHFGMKIKARHRAMGDAEATARILLQFLEIAVVEHDVETIEQLIKLQNKRTVAKPIPNKQVHVRDKVREFPERPGVYVMQNSAGEVLYVGKAKNLHDRVGSYFTKSTQDSNRKLARLMRIVKDISYEETGSELSALLLESRKIKELKPRFNSMERRYKSYTFLKLDVQHDFPRLEAVRQPATDGAEYFGPFRSFESVEALIDVLNRSFKLRECGTEFSVKAGNKPCFYHDIKRCDAPCAQLISQADYRKEVDRLRDFLSTGEEGVIKLVEEMMFAAAERLDFEEAQFLKVRLFELRRVLGEGERQIASLNENDFVIMTPISDGRAEVFFVRYGRLAKQMIVDRTHIDRSEDWFARQLRMYYSAVSAIPPLCGKPEIDEMRILSSWADRKKRKGESITHYLTKDWEEIVAKLAKSLNALLKPMPKAMLELPVATAPAILTPLNVAPNPPAQVLEKRSRIVLRPMAKK